MEQYKIFRVGCCMHYTGTMLIGAESKEEVRVFIIESKLNDKHNRHDTWGWDEHDIEEIEYCWSEIRGIIENDIRYTG